MPKYIALVAISIAAAATVAVGEELTPDLIKEHGISKADIAALLAGKSIEDEEATKAAKAKEAKASADVAESFATARTKAAESAEIAKEMDTKPVKAAKAEAVAKK
jgi:hypothetical protein